MIKETSFAIEVANLTVSYNTKPALLDVNVKIEADQLVGVIGPNGAGKTTLFKMITGQDAPDSGTIRTGESVKLAYVDQSRDILDPEKTIWETIADGNDVIMLGDREINSRDAATTQLAGRVQQPPVTCGCNGCLTAAMG